jgi:hypothetical protein
MDTETRGSISEGPVVALAVIDLCSDHGNGLSDGSNIFPSQNAINMLDGVVIVAHAIPNFA